MYLHCTFAHQKVVGLLDTGCSINVMSEQLYKSLPSACKSQLYPSHESSVKLADSRHIDILGIARIKGHNQYGSCKFTAYILPKTSHPLILGTKFMTQYKIVLDFSTFSHSFVQKTLKVKCRQEVHVLPSSECIVQGQLPKGVILGTQGICTASKQILNTGLLAARSVVTVQNSRRVPVKILNPGNTTVVLQRGTVLVNLETMDGSHHVMPFNTSLDHVNEISCNNVVIEKPGEHREECGDNQTSPNPSDFLSNFNLNIPNLSPSQVKSLESCLYDNKDVFVTPENPSLGFHKGCRTNYM